MSHDFVKIPRKQKERKMGDLHSIAYCGNLLHSSSLSLGWDHYFHNNLGLLNNSDFSHYVESNSTPPFYSSADSISTGYLEDALFEFNSKRRRMLLFSGDQTDQSTYNNPIWNYWNNSNCNDDEDSYDFKLDDLSHEFSVDNVAGNKSMEEETNMEEMKKGETNIDNSSSSSQSKSSSVNTKCLLSDKQSTPYNNSYEGERIKKRVVTRVAYPFAMVKPGGFEGDTTLNEINRRILMPPTRAVRHPVGDFACRPLVSTPNCPGLSGKEVVALTRIQTQGRGTITIIRTKG